MAFKEATFYAPPDTPLVPNLSISTRDVIVGDPGGLQGELRVEWGADFADQFNTHITVLRKNQQGDDVEVAQTVPTVPSTALEYGIDESAAGMTDQARASFGVGDAIPGHTDLGIVGVWWKLPDGGEGNSATTPYFTVPTDGELRYKLRIGDPGATFLAPQQPSQIPEGQTELMEVTVRFPRIGAPKPPSPLIDAEIGGATFRNVVHLRGPRQRLAGVVLQRPARGQPSRCRLGARYRLGPDHGGQEADIHAALARRGRHLRRRRCDGGQRLRGASASRSCAPVPSSSVTRPGPSQPRRPWSRSPAKARSPPLRRRHLRGRFVSRDRRSPRCRGQRRIGAAERHRSDRSHGRGRVAAARQRRRSDPAAAARAGPDDSCGPFSCSSISTNPKLSRTPVALKVVYPLADDSPSLASDPRADEAPRSCAPASGCSRPGGRRRPAMTSWRNCREWIDGAAGRRTIASILVIGRTDDLKYNDKLADNKTYNDGLAGRRRDAAVTKLKAAGVAAADIITRIETAALPPFPSELSGVYAPPSAFPPRGASRCRTAQVQKPSGATRPVWNSAWTPDGATSAAHATAIATTARRIGYRCADIYAVDAGTAPAAATIAAGR